MNWITDKLRMWTWLKRASCSLVILQFIDIKIVYRSYHCVILIDIWLLSHKSPFDVMKKWFIHHSTKTSRSVQIGNFRTTILTVLSIHFSPSKKDFPPTYWLFQTNLLYKIPRPFEIVLGKMDFLLFNRQNDSGQTWYKVDIHE